MKLLLFLLTLLAGIVIGATSMYFQSYEEVDIKKSIPPVSLDKLFQQTNMIISEENYACEGPRLKAVGEVIASIYERSIYKARNMFAYTCYDNLCTLSVTDCKPWQSSECGSRILRFEISEKNEILENSFACIETP